MASTAFDLGLRGVAVGLFLVICIVLLRCAPLRLAARLALAMSVAGAAYAISTAPFFPTGAFGWNSPFVVLSMGFPVVFWLWAHAIFDENFALRPWHGVLWALVAGLGLMAYNGWSEWPDLAATCSRLLALASIGFALLAAAFFAVLAFGAWRIALVFTVLNALLIGYRISVEERALAPRT